MRRPGVRFSITEKCNYQCFFCHEEGLEMERTRRETGEAELYRLFDQLKVDGYEDFTFTGGEPLLKWRQIVRLLAYLRTIDYLPTITIVSNGRALTAEFVNQIRDYPGGMRFNVSMHSLDPEQHHRIVHRLDPRTSGVRDDLSRIQANLELLRAAGIPFKLNFVLLKGINTAPAEIARILDYALVVGAQRVKFLELLITKKLKALYPYYYRLQALRDQLGEQITLVGAEARREVYRYRDTPLEIELQGCTCSAVRVATPAPTIGISTSPPNCAISPASPTLRRMRTCTSPPWPRPSPLVPTISPAWRTTTGITARSSFASTT